MTIRRGESWGEAVDVPPGLTVLDDDAAVHRWLVPQRQRGAPIAALGLGGGDLARTMAGGLCPPLT